MVSFLKHYQYHQIGMPPSSAQSRHHQLPFVLHYPTSSLWGFSTSPLCHPDSFHSFILWAGFLSPNLLFYFRFGQTRSETKTLQIVLESFCVHSPAHASFYLFQGGSSCLSSLSSLESAFIHCGVHPFLSMLPLWSPSPSPRCSSHPPWFSPPSWSGTMDWRLCSSFFWQGRPRRS